MATGGMRTTFVGREAELSRLRALADRALTAGPVLRAVISGEAGIGKTRLLAEFLASDTGAFELLHGTCRALDYGRAFGPFLDATPRGRGTLQSRLARAMPGTEHRPGHTEVQAASPALRNQAVDRLAEILVERSVRRPVLLVVDDLQLGDAGTIGLLHRLATTSDPARMLLVGTVRAEPVDAELAALLSELRDADGEDMELRPLARPSVQEMASSMLGAPPGRRLWKLIGSAHGSPLFVAELISALQQDGMIRIQRGVAETSDRLMRPTLRSTLLRRLAFLSASALDLLRVATVFGRSFTLRELALIAGRADADVSRDLLEGISSGVLTDGGDHLAFAHDLIRDALYEEMPRAVRRDLHRTAADALISGGAAPEVIASQLKLAARPGDELAVHWLRVAATRDVTRSPAVAVGLLEHARKIAAPRAHLRHEVDADLAAALVSVGRLDAAEGVARDALAEAPAAPVRSRLHRVLADALFWAERNREAAVELERAARGLPAQAPMRGRLLAELAGRLVADIQLERGLHHARAALRIGRPLRDDLTLAAGVDALAYGRLLGGWVTEARRLQGLACGYAQATEDPQLAWHARYSTACFTWHADRFAEADMILRRERSRATADRAGWKLLLIARSSIVVYASMGRWRDLEVPIAEMRRHHAHNDVSMDGATALATLAAVATERDELIEAERLMGEADEHGRLMGRYDDLLAATRSLVLEAKGELPRALELARHAVDLVERKGSLVRLRVYGMDLVRVALAASDQTLAERIAGMLEVLSARARLPSVAGLALHARGLVANDVATLRGAAETLRLSPRRVNLARACEDAGTLAVALGRTDGPDLLREALEIYEDLGARRGVRRVERSLRAAGKRRGSMAPRRTAHSGWASLTDAERRVVRLLAEGLTNGQIADRLFLSRRTVESHVARAYAKLGVSSRVQLAAMATKVQESTRGALAS